MLRHTDRVIRKGLDLLGADCIILVTTRHRETGVRGGST